MIRIAIVEDHAAIAEGLAALLSTDDVRVVGTAPTVDGGATLIREHRPDVVVCDIMLGGHDAGFDLLDRYGRQARFLMLSAYDYPAHHAHAVAAGARGYLSKMVDGRTLLDAIRTVASGGTVFTPAVLASARQAPRAPTARERQLFSLLAAGATNDQIAESLGIAVKTVEGMLRRLFDRYGVSNRTQLVQVANSQGWLTSTLR